MMASAMAELRSANKRADAPSPDPFSATAERAMLFQVGHSGGAWNLAMTVCSSLRCALSLEPSDIVSATSRFHCSLSRAGGGPGRNWSPLVKVQGTVPPQWGAIIGFVEVAT